MCKKGNWGGSKMITREECEKALNTLKEKYVGFDVVDELIYFKMLIEEHFDNPPLKLNEIKIGVKIWYLLEDKMIDIFRIEEENGCTWFSYMTDDSNMWHTCKYHYGIFFRKEVK